MVVRLRFKRGPSVERRLGKNSRLALFGASLLTLGSVTCFILGMWRLCFDLGWAGPFVFPGGFLSHMQVWLAGAVVLQFLSWKLTRYGRIYEALSALPEAPREHIVVRS